VNPQTNDLLLGWMRGQDYPLRSNVVPQQSVRGVSRCADTAVMDIDHDDRRVDQGRAEPMVAGVCGKISENIDLDRPVGVKVAKHRGAGRG
jgi:hypothetical protein